MNELIKVEIKNNQQVVSARELHKGLGVKTRFSLWVEQNFKMFVKGEDFMGVVTTTPQNQYGGLQTIDDYAITLNMAEHVAMMSKTEMGSIYRQYFIELEKKWNDPKEVVKRGYDILLNENTQLKLENKRLLPKARFADSVATATTDILVGDLAKILYQNGIEIGQNRLFGWLRHNKYLGSSGSYYNMPTQTAMKLGLFRIKETTITHSDGHTSISKTTKVTGKGQNYFIQKFLSKTEVDKR